MAQQMAAKTAPEAVRRHDGSPGPRPPPLPRYVPLQAVQAPAPQRPPLQTVNFTAVVTFVSWPPYAPITTTHSDLLLSYRKAVLPLRGTALLRIAFCIWSRPNATRPARLAATVLRSRCDRYRQVWNNQLYVLADRHQGGIRGTQAHPESHVDSTGSFPYPGVDFSGFTRGLFWELP